MSKIIIYTDGGARNNGKENNIGGYGIVLQYVTRDNTYIKELYAGERNTTNNIQEMKGLIVALETIKTTSIPIELYCDSAYVVNGVNDWMNGWKKRGWRKSDGKVIENLELWKRIYELVNMQKDLQVKKIKGHAGHEGNEKADELANRAMNEVEMND